MYVCKLHVSVVNIYFVLCTIYDININWCVKNKKKLKCIDDCVSCNFVFTHNHSKILCLYIF